MIHVHWQHVAFRLLLSLLCSSILLLKFGYFRSFTYGCRNIFSSSKYCSRCSYLVYSTPSNTVIPRHFHASPFTCNTIYIQYPQDESSDSCRSLSQQAEEGRESATSTIGTCPYLVTLKLSGIGEPVPTLPLFTDGQCSWYRRDQHLTLIPRKSSACPEVIRI